MTMPSWEGQSAHLTFDVRVYALDVVKKAAYVFSDRCQIGLSLSEDGGTIHCRLSLLQPLESEQKDKLLGQFMNEVLDQDLRQTIFQETEAVRNLILAQAFSNTSLLDDV